MIKVEPKASTNATYLRCWLADETALIEGSFPYHNELKKDAVLEFTNVKSLIVRQTGRLCLNTTPFSTIRPIEHKLWEVNKSLNMSRLDWVNTEGYDIGQAW